MTPQESNGHFYSPTHGTLSQQGVRVKMLTFMREDPQSAYRIIIGSDSQPANHHGTDFVTAIVVHRKGFGGIYFWKRIVHTKKYALRERIFTEATFSLTTADEVVELFKNDGISRYDLEIHVDIGPKGETRDMIAEIVGMIRGSGFTVKIKPDSYGASKIADRHT